MTDPVAEGYDAVYAAWRSAGTFHEIWAQHAVDGRVAPGFEHISFSPVEELERVAVALDVHDGDRLVDIACGAGGPGMWVARRSGASLVGLDLSEVGARLAADRAVEREIDGPAFVVGTATAVALADACMAGAMSIDALQYVPDKRAVFAELARILVPRGRLVFTAFELDPDRVRGLPVLGIDPVADYSGMLMELGFRVDVYEETPRWRERLTSSYSAVLAARDALTREMGADAMSALEVEMTLTLETEPYRGHVFASARRR